MIVCLCYMVSLPIPASFGRSLLGAFHFAVLLSLSSRYYSSSIATQTASLDPVGLLLSVLLLYSSSYSSLYCNYMAFTHFPFILFHIQTQAFKHRPHLTTSIYTLILIPFLIPPGKHTSTITLYPSSHLVSSSFTSHKNIY